MIVYCILTNDRSQILEIAITNYNEVDLLKLDWFRLSQPLPANSSNATVAAINNQLPLLPEDIPNDAFFSGVTESEFDDILANAPCCPCCITF